MSCKKHLLRCKCEENSQVAPASVPTPVPTPHPRPWTKKPRLKRRSPWRLRYEEEQAKKAAEADLMNQVEQAILSGKGDLVLKQLVGVLALQSFSAFCQAAWHVVEPSTKLDWGQHHELLCTVLQSLLEDWLLTKDNSEHIPNIVNTAFNVCPGSLKSKLISVFFHAYAWLRCPGMKFICLSVNESAAMRDARATRDLIRSDWYQDTFAPTWTIKGDQDAISNFGNTEGGERLSQASGSEIVGMRGDCLIIDDANNPNEADSKTERAKVNRLWDTNMYNRVNDPVKSLRIGIQQRTASLDWTGHVISKQGTWSPTNKNGWLHVVLPAEFELSRPAFVLPKILCKLVKHIPTAVIRDWRTKEGEVLHPKRMTADYLAGEKRRWAGSGNYAGQMQQRPTAESGGKIKKAWLGWFKLARGVRDDIDELPNGRPRPEGAHQGEAVLISGVPLQPGRWDFDRVMISVDAALKKTEAGSLWGMLAIGCQGAKRFILDDCSERYEPDEAVDVLKTMIERWLPDVVLIEDKAGGPGMACTIRIEMADGRVPMAAVEVFNPGISDKDARLGVCSSNFKNGFVYLLDGAAWVDDVFDEIVGFDAYPTDDRLDSILQSILYERSSGYTLPSSGGWAEAGLG